MAYTVTAHQISTKKIISSITFGYHHPVAEEFLKLMGVSKSIIRKVYTQEELKQARKNSVNYIVDVEQRRDIKQFLTDCVNASENSNIDIWFV